MRRRGVVAAAAAALTSACPLIADAQPGAGAAPVDLSERAYVTGNGLLGRGLYELAIAEYRSFLAAHPEHAKAPLARYGLGVALMSLGRHGEALEQLAAIKPGAGFPYTVEVAVMLGQCRLALGEYGDAAVDFERALVRHGGHELADDAAALLSEARYRSEDLRGAVRASASLAERWPDSPARGTAELFGGLALLELGDGVGASAVLRSAVERLGSSPLREYGMLALARALIQSGSGGDAEPVLRDVLRSTDAEIRVGAAVLLADVLRARGELTDARRVLEDAAGLAEPGAWRGDLLFRLGQVCFDEQQFEEALARFEESAAEEEGRADQAVYWAAKCCLRLDRYEEAARRLASALARHEGSGIRAEMKYDLAVALLRAGREAEAGRAFDDFRAEFPRHELWPEATRVSGSIALRSGHAEAALAAANELLRHPAGEADHAAARLMIAQAHAAAGRDEDAAAAYRDYLAQHPQDELAAYASLELATLLLKRGDVQEARGLLEVVTNHHDAVVSGPALLLLGDMELAAERWAEAAARYRAYRSLPDAPAVDEALLKLGIALAHGGQTEEARAALSRLAGDGRAGSLAARALFELGMLELAAGDLAAAQRAFRAVAEDDAAAEIAPYALFHLGLVAERAEQWEEAAAILEGLLRNPGELAPDALMQVRYRLGALQARLARHEDAAATLRELLAHAEALGPTVRTSATLLLADSLAALERHEEAASLLRPLAADPPDAATGAGALLRLGDALARMQDWPGSEEAFAAFLERAPDSERWFQARFGLGWARENLGRYEEAIEQYRHVVERHHGPTAARAQFQIGECLMALSRHGEAAAELLKVDILYAYPEWSAAALFEAGRCFEALGNVAEARRQYAAVQERFGQTHWAELARSRMAAAKLEPIHAR